VTSDLAAAHPRSGPVVIGYDGSEASVYAIREAGPLLSGRPALVVVVYKAGVGFELLETPTVTGLPPASLDVRTAMEIDRELAERSRRLSQQGAALAREAGFSMAEGLAVSDDLDTPIGQTLVDVARERHAQALVVGAHGHGGLAALLGSTSRDVVRRSDRPVVVVRQRGDDDR
jgi:nucleotide-binding universal stress UspA family protein